MLRYLSDSYRALSRTIPLDYLDNQLEDIIAWLGLMVRSVDSSLVDEWEAAGSFFDEVPPQPSDVVVIDRRGLTVMVRNALFLRVKLAARREASRLGALDADWNCGERRWRQALDAFYEAHDEILLDADARSMAYLTIDEIDEWDDHVWHVHQIFSDSDGDHDFGIAADVDLDATQTSDGVVFTNYRVGPIEDLLR